MNGNGQGIEQNQKKVLQLLETVVAERSLITIGLPENAKNYRTRLLSLEGSDGKKVLSLAPLEPADGNLKIRSCRVSGTIMVAFVSANQLYQGNSTFLDVVLADGGQVLHVSLPEQLKATEKIRRRTENRVVIPDNIDLVASVIAKGQKKVSVTLEDLSSGGLSFSCPSLTRPFVDGDSVGLVIEGAVLKGESIPLSGIIRRRVVLRNGAETHARADYYGLQFKHLSPATAMALDRLVRLRIPAPEEAWFVTEPARYSP